MNATRDPDQILHAWLEEGPTVLPAPTVRAIEVATRATTQRRRVIRLPWRSEPMTSSAKVLAIAAALALLIGGAFAAGVGRAPDSALGPSPTPSPSASPSGSPGSPVPADLQGRWVGPPRTLEGFSDPSTEIAIVFDTNSLNLEGYAVAPPDQIRSSASLVEAGQIGLVTAGGSDTGCTEGDVGQYTYAIAPLKAELTLSVLSDACPIRGTALAGSWVRSVDANLTTFTSTLYGYMTRHPSSWRAIPATEPWKEGWLVAPDVPYVDTFHPVGTVVGAVVAIAAQPVLEGVTADAWMADWAEFRERTEGACFGPASAWTDATVAGFVARRIQAPCDFAQAGQSEFLEYAWVVDGIGYVMTGTPTVVETMATFFRP